MIVVKSFENLLEKVVNIVKDAAKLMGGKDFEIKEKSSIENIVTSADIAVQNYLKEKLKKLTPACGFLCEEEKTHELGFEYVWIIDPIDGTNNFSRGISDCAVSVALSFKKEIVLGVVYSVAKNELFSAVKEKGATFNGKKISVSSRPFRNGLLCSAMSLYEKSLAPVCFDIISDVYSKSNDLRRFGSCALELCYLAAGKCDLYFEIRIYPWDYAAAYLILTEAGGILTGLNAKPLTFDKITVLIGANNKENHKILVDIINKHLPETPYNEEI